MRIAIYCPEGMEAAGNAFLAVAWSEGDGRTFDLAPVAIIGKDRYRVAKGIVPDDMVARLSADLVEPEWPVDMKAAEAGKAALRIGEKPAPGIIAVLIDAPDGPI
jgi:hypothetical protein